MTLLRKSNWIKISILALIISSTYSCDFFLHKKQSNSESHNGSTEKSTTASSKIKNGRKEYYYPTGQLKSIVTYKNNKKTGISQTYYKSGEKQYDIPYVDGMKHGTVKWYYKSGKVYRETQYKRGKKDGVQKKFWENGNLKSQMLFKQNMSAKGLREFTKKALEKSAPHITVERIDLLKTKEEYVLRCKLSNGRRKVQFYVGELIEGKFFTDKGNRFHEMDMKNGVGEFRIQVPKDFQIIKDIPIVAVEHTAYQNQRILTKTVSVSIRNGN